MFLLRFPGLSFPAFFPFLRFLLLDFDRWPYFSSSGDNFSTVGSTRLADSGRTGIFGSESAAGGDSTGSGCGTGS
jgi:hypothetical protein